MTYLDRLREAGRPGQMNLRDDEDPYLKMKARVPLLVAGDYHVCNVGNRLKGEVLSSFLLFWLQ